MCGNLHKRTPLLVYPEQPEQCWPGMHTLSVSTAAPAWKVGDLHHCFSSILTRPHRSSQAKQAKQAKQQHPTRQLCSHVGADAGEAHTITGIHTGRKRDSQSGAAALLIMLPRRGAAPGAALMGRLHCRACRGRHTGCRGQCMPLWVRRGPARPGAGCFEVLGTSRTSRPEGQHPRARADRFNDA